MKYLLVPEATARALANHLERAYIPATDEGFLIKGFLADVDQARLRSVERTPHVWADLAGMAHVGLFVCQACRRRSDDPSTPTWCVGKPPEFPEVRLAPPPEQQPYLLKPDEGS